MKGLSNKMKMLSVSEVATTWNISERMVRELCTEGRVPGAKLDNGVWSIPCDTSKPERKSRKTSDQPNPNLTAFAKRVIYQRSKNNHYGIYEYIQVNLAYSSNRMASNRLTRSEVEEIYRSNKITTSFEPAKVDDIIETINHFSAVRYVVDHISEPLTQKYIKELHSILTYGTYADRKGMVRSGKYRLSTPKMGVSPSIIANSLSSLLKDYEANAISMERIIDFHVQFESIHPFEDYNGRVGRLIILKECLRHGIDPFIIDDKSRGKYNKGIAIWHATHEPLMAVAFDAQKRFQSKIELCSLFLYARYSKRIKQNKRDDISWCTPLFCSFSE